MLRKAEWLVAAALVLTTTGCVESMDSGYGAPSYGYGYGYGNGYSNGYSNSYSGGYYAPQAYYSPPVVYSQTRYVPVPTQVPVPLPTHQANRGGDQHRDGRHDEPRHVDRQPSPPPSPPTTHNNGGSGNRRDGTRQNTSRDRDGDGRPDRRS